MLNWNIIQIHKRNGVKLKNTAYALYPLKKWTKHSKRVGEFSINYPVVSTWCHQSTSRTAKSFKYNWSQTAAPSLGFPVSVLDCRTQTVLSNTIKPDQLQIQIRETFHHPKNTPRNLPNLLFYPRVLSPPPSSLYIASLL